MTSEEKNLRSRLMEITVDFAEATKRYLNGFDANSIISFTDSDEIRKKHLRDYNNFSVILKTHVESLEKNISVLSSFICEADKACDKETTERLVKLFDAYSDLFVSITKFLTNCDTVFLNRNSQFRESVIMGYTRELFCATEIFKTNL